MGGVTQGVDGIAEQEGGGKGFAGKSQVGQGLASFPGEVDASAKQVRRAQGYGGKDGYGRDMDRNISG
jgi:hypothetical protein